MSLQQFADGDHMAPARGLVRDSSSSFAHLGSATGSPLAQSRPLTPIDTPRLLHAFQYHPPASARRGTAEDASVVRSTPTPHPPGVHPTPPPLQQQYQQQAAQSRTPKPPPPSALSSAASSPSPSSLEHRNPHSHSRPHSRPQSHSQPQPQLQPQPQPHSQPHSQHQRAALQIAELRADVERRRASAAAAFAAEADAERYAANTDPRMNAWMAEAVRALPPTPPLSSAQLSSAATATTATAATAATAATRLALTPTPPQSQHKLQQQQQLQQQPGRSSNKKADQAHATFSGLVEPRSLFGFASAAGVVAAGTDGASPLLPLSARRPLTSQQQQSRQHDAHNALDQRRAGQQLPTASSSSSLSFVETIGTDASSLGAYVAAMRIYCVRLSSHAEHVCLFYLFFPSFRSC